MQNDLISRSALIAYVKELPTYEPTDRGFIFKRYPSGLFAPDDIVKSIQNAPAVDAIVLPKGRPGDYLEWETGIIGHTTIQPINAILICEDCVRYDLGVFAPTVDHENIVRIMSREEAKREIERRGDDGK